MVGEQPFAIDVGPDQTVDSREYLITIDMQTGDVISIEPRPEPLVTDPPTYPTE